MKLPKDTYRTLVLGICFLSFALSVYGLHYGLPLHLIGDEESLIGGAMRMMQLRTLAPVLHPEEFQLLYYLPVIPYLILISSIPVIVWELINNSFSLSHVTNLFATDQTALWISARMLTAVTASFLVYLVYRIGQLLFTKRAGLLASLFLATSFLHVNLSHWMKHWIFTVTASVIVFFLVARVTRNHGKHDNWLPGLMSGIALGVTPLTGIGVAFSWIYALYMRHSIPNWKRFIVKNWIIAFLTGSTLIVLHVRSFLTLAAGNDSTISATKTVQGFLETLSYGVKTLVFIEPVLFLILVFGLALSFRRRRLMIMIWTLVLGYIGVLFFFLHIEVRYMYYGVPLFAIGAGVLFDDFLETKKSTVGLVVLVLLVLCAGGLAIQQGVLLSRPDTRNEAVRWIEDNITSEEFIISSPSIILKRSRESLEREQAIASLRFSERYYMNPEVQEDHNSERYRYSNLHFWNTKALNDLNSYLDENRPEYFIVEYWDRTELSRLEWSTIAGSDLIVSFRQSDSGVQNYDINGNFLEPNALVFGIKRLGPRVDIYKINYVDSER